MNNFRPQTLQLDTAAVACAVVRHSSAESLVLGCDDAVINEIDTNGDLCDSSNISNILLPCGQGDFCLGKPNLQKIHFLFMFLTTKNLNAVATCTRKYFSPARVNRMWIVDVSIVHFLHHAPNSQSKQKTSKKTLANRQCKIKFCDRK